jgi:hypothetical protein
MENQNEQQINIELTEEMAEGIYSNLAVITHSHTEFIADFVQMMPGTPKAKVRSRVLMAPANAKRLMMALMENVQKYEQQFGKIDEGNSNAVPPLNFGGPISQA